MILNIHDKREMIILLSKGGGGLMHIKNLRLANNKLGVEFIEYEINCKIHVNHKRISY